MPVLSEVHQPDASSVDGALRYTAEPYYPSLYSPRAPAPAPARPPCQAACSPSTAADDGNDYTQMPCAPTVAIGMVVQALAANADAILQPAESANPQPAIGIVIARPDASTAKVQTDGLVTQGLQDLQPGANYFVGASGGLLMPPLAGIEFVQLVGQAQSPTSLYLANSGQVYKRQNQDDAQDQN